MRKMEIMQTLSLVGNCRTNSQTKIVLWIKFDLIELNKFLSEKEMYCELFVYQKFDDRRRVNRMQFFHNSSFFYFNLFAHFWIEYVSLCVGIHKDMKWNKNENDIQNCNKKIFYIWLCWIVKAHFLFECHMMIAKHINTH